MQSYRDHFEASIPMVSGYIHIATFGRPERKHTPKIESYSFPYFVRHTSIMAAIRSGVTPTCLLKCLLRKSGKPGRGNHPLPAVWNYVGLLEWGTSNIISVIRGYIRGGLNVSWLAGLACLRRSNGRTLVCVTLTGAASACTEQFALITNTLVTVVLFFAFSLHQS